MERITNTAADAIVGEIAKGEYKRDVRSRAWAGNLVAKRCGLDTKAKVGRDCARLILEPLIENGVLTAEGKYDEHRNYREYVVPHRCAYCGRGAACDCFGCGV